MEEKQHWAVIVSTTTHSNSDPRIVMVDGFSEQRLAAEAAAQIENRLGTNMRVNTVVVRLS